MSDNKYYVNYAEIGATRRNHTAKCIDPSLGILRERRIPCLQDDIAIRDSLAQDDIAIRLIWDRYGA